MPSLIRIGYFLLLPTSCASTEAQAGVTSCSIASLRRVGQAESLLEASLAQRVLMAFTNTRVPSLFTATVSERWTRARIWAKVVGVSGFEGSGRTSARVLSTMCQCQR